MKFVCAQLCLCLCVLAMVAQCSMLLEIQSLQQPYTFKRAVIENQICKGKFLLETKTEGAVNVYIYSEDMKRVFRKDKMRSGEEVVFSFNTTNGQTYTVKIEESESVPEKIRMVYEFTSQYNTFNKKVAKYEVIDPALAEMTKFEKLLYELSLQTSFRQKETAAFSDSINEIVVTILGINVVMFIGLAGIVMYLVYSFKDFLKKKKMI